MGKILGKNHYAFIDIQNLYLALKGIDIFLNYSRFRVFLREKYHIEKAFIFIGYIEKNKTFYENLKKAGFILVFKPTLTQSGVIKGNCDAELVMHTMIELEHFNKAMIISGDGDFYCLIEHLQKEQKLLKVGIPNKRKYSSLLKKFRSPYFWYIEDSKNKISY
jgi:uncharacterized LabA/DUF88 family protein